MPIITRQRRGQQIGEIRIGIQLQTKDKNGKPTIRPSKLEAFRFTTRSSKVAAALAEQFGVTASETALANGAKTWEVITTATELDVIIPPGDAAISQWFELWTAAGRDRQCDGETEMRTQSECKCPFDSEKRKELASKGQACRPTTRLNVILPDVPDLGVWKLESHGYNAADELGVKAEMLAQARERGVVIPATLRLEQRETRIVGEPPRRYAVPVLEINKSFRELASLDASHGIRAALDQVTPTRVAIGSAPGSRAELQAAPSAPTQDDGDDDIIDAVLVEEMEPSPESAQAVDLAELVTLRTKANLSGPRWAQFAAKALGRAVSLGDSNFSPEEVRTLIIAIKSGENR